MIKTTTLNLCKVINCESLCIRKEPSTESEILTIAARGSLLDFETKDSDSEWYYVKSVDGVPVNGYCMAQYTEGFLPAIGNEVEDGRGK